MDEHVDPIKCRADELMLNEELRLRVLERLSALHSAYMGWKSIEGTVDPKRNDILEAGHHAFSLIQAVVQGNDGGGQRTYLDASARTYLERVARLMGYSFTAPDGGWYKNPDAEAKATKDMRLVGSG